MVQEKPCTGVLIHERMHNKYNLIIGEGKLGDYPTLNRHMQREYSGEIRNGRSYHGQHNAMAEGNFELIVKGMRQFDELNGTSHSKVWYEAMAWRGSLREFSSAWSELPENKQYLYNRLIINEIVYENYLKSTAEGDLIKAAEWKNKINKELWKMSGRDAL